MINESALSVEYGCIGERSTQYFLRAMLRVPLTIEVIDLKAPLFLMLEGIYYIFKISTVDAVRGKILNKFKGGVIIEYLLLILCFIDEIRIRHITFLCEHGDYQEAKDEE